jgi:hypothetical protein
MSADKEQIAQAQASKDPVAIVGAFLANSGKDSVAYAASQLVAEDATYTSLNFENPELQQIEPLDRHPQRPSGVCRHFLQCRHVLGRERLSGD